MKRRSVRLTALAVGVLLATSSRARAQEPSTGELEGLLNESVVSTASKAAETASVAPGTSIVLTAEELRVFGVTKISEALRYLPLGITVVDSGHPSVLGAGIAVRGVRYDLGGSRHILWLVNGHRMNDPFSGNAIVELPIEIVDHIEIVLGPGSVLYGSNAMQAVVNVILKDAASFSRLRVGVESRPLVALRPWAGGGHRFELFGVPGDVVAAAQYSGQDGPTLDYPQVNLGLDPLTGQPYRYRRDPVGTGIWGGRAENVSYRSVSGVAHVTLGDLKLGLYTQLTRGPLIADPADFDARLSRTIDRSLRIDLHHERALSSRIRVSERLYADSVDSLVGIETSRGPSCIVPGGTCVGQVLGESQWVGTDLQGRVDWLTNGTLVTTLGADLALRRVRSKTDIFDVATGNAVTPSTGMIDRTTPLLAGYGQQTWSPLRWLDLNAGARLDYDPRFPAVLSPREAIRVVPWTSGAIKLVHSEAFRAPSFRESDFANPVVPLPDDLKPERIRSFEASFEQALGAHRLLFGVFDSAWRNLIEMRTLTPTESAELVAQGKTQIPPIYQHRNVARIATRGFNAGYEGSARAGRLKYALNLTSAIAREDVGPLAGTPGFSGNARVSYDLGGHWPTVGVVSAFYGRALAAGAIRGGFRPLPYAPAQVDVRLVVAGHVPHLERLTYRAWVSYAVADRSPNTVGPISAPIGPYNAPILAPIDQVRGLVGLAYEF